MDETYDNGDPIRKVADYTIQSIEEVLKINAGKLQGETLVKAAVDCVGRETKYYSPVPLIEVSIPTNKPFSPLRRLLNFGIGKTAEGFYRRSGYQHVGKKGTTKFFDPTNPEQNTKKENKYGNRIFSSKQRRELARNANYDNQESTEAPSQTPSSATTNIPTGPYH